MDLKNYIERLSAVYDIVQTISKEAGIAAVVFNCGTYWTLRCHDSAGDLAYMKDFDSLDELVNHIDAILVGINLANGREV